MDNRQIISIKDHTQLLLKRSRFQFSLPVSVILFVQPNVSTSNVTVALQTFTRLHSVAKPVSPSSALEILPTPG